MIPDGVVGRLEDAVTRMEILPQNLETEADEFEDAASETGCDDAQSARGRACRSSSG